MVVQVGNDLAAAVEVAANSAAVVEGKTTAVEDDATTLVDACKEDMVEVVRIFWGLREEKMGNVVWGGTCMVLKYYYFFQCRYPEQSLPRKIN